MTDATRWAHTSAAGRPPNAPSLGPLPPPSLSDLGNSPPKRSGSDIPPTFLCPPEAVTVAPYEGRMHFLDASRSFVELAAPVQSSLALVPQPHSAAPSLCFTYAPFRRSPPVIEDGSHWNCDQEIARAEPQLDYLHPKQRVHKLVARLAVLREAAAFITAQVCAEESKLKHEKQVMASLEGNDALRFQVAVRPAQRQASNEVPPEQQGCTRRWRPVLDELKPYDPNVDVDVMTFLLRFQRLCVRHEIPYWCWAHLLFAALPPELSDAVFHDWESGNPIDPCNFLAMKRSIVSKANAREGDLATVYCWKLEHHQWDPAKGLSQFLQETLELYNLWSTAAGYSGRMRNADTLRRDFLVGPLLRKVPPFLVRDLGRHPETLTFDELKHLLNAAYSRHLMLCTASNALSAGRECDDRPRFHFDGQDGIFDGSLSRGESVRGSANASMKADRDHGTRDTMVKPNGPRTPAFAVECKFDPCRRSNCPFKHRPDHNRHSRGWEKQEFKSAGRWRIKEENDHRLDLRRISFSLSATAGIHSRAKFRSELEYGRHNRFADDRRIPYSSRQKDGAATLADRFVKTTHFQASSLRSDKVFVSGRHGEEHHEKDLYGRPALRALSPSVADGRARSRPDKSSLSTSVYNRNDSQSLASVSPSRDRRECPA